VASLGVRVLIVAVIVVGGIIFRDRLTGNASDLKAGDCFDTDTATEVKDVQHHPCTEAHTAEVVLVVNHTAAKGAPYPADSEIDTWADATCVPAILSYVGPTADLSALNYGIFYPKDSDWTDGERQMICYVMRLDLGSMTQSLRSAAG
jgi:hypothetical protein